MVAKKHRSKCRLQHIPKRLRLVLAVVLTGFGSLLFIMPLPGGIVLVSAGLLMGYCSSATLRAGISRRLERFPQITAILKPFLAACDNCANAEHSAGTGPAASKPAAPLNSKKIA
jgi:hypothetical protein